MLARPSPANEEMRDGEQYVDQHANNGFYSSAFRFNDSREGSTASAEGSARSAEYDEYTGQYYYGARYHDPLVGVWISPDPMFFARPGLTPYNFVQNNPIMLWDPTGMLDSGGEDEDPPQDGDTRTVDGVSQKYNAEAGEWMTIEGAFGNHIDLEEIEVTAEKSNESNANSTVNDASQGLKTSNLILAMSAGTAAITLREIEGDILKFYDRYGQLSSNDIKAANNISRLNKAIRLLGRVSGAGAIAISLNTVANNPNSTEAWLKLAGNLALLGARINPVALLVLSILDITGVTDYIYKETADVINEGLFDLKY